MWEITVNDYNKPITCQAPFYEHLTEGETDTQRREVDLWRCLLQNLGSRHVTLYCKIPGGGSGRGRKITDRGIERKKEKNRQRQRHREM